LSERKESLEELEEKSWEGIREFLKPEFKRRISYLIVSFLVLAIVSLVPSPMEAVHQRALGVLLFIVILWVTEAFPLGMSALFGISLLPTLDILPLQEAFFGFKDPALFFLIGALSFGIAMQKTNLHKRVALKVIKRMGKDPSKIVLSICLLGGFLSMTMPSHAVAALLLPVIVLMVKAGDIGRGQNFGIVIFLALTYATSVGSIGTLLGGARNILALGILEATTGETLSFLEWAVAGIPIGIVLIFLTFFTLRFIYPWEKFDTSEIRSEIKKQVDEMGDFSWGEKKASFIFCITVAMWVLFGQRMGLSIIAIAGFFALVVTRTITWRDIKTNMAWDLIFLYGGALTLSHALTTTGAMDFVSTVLVGVIGDNPLIILVTFLLFVIFVSNVMSNAAALTVMLPLAITTIVLELGVGIQFSGKIVSLLIAMGSAMVFLLPIGTPSAAIVYSSGYVDVKKMIKAGAVLTLVSIVILLTFGLGWWRLLGMW